MELTNKIWVSCSWLLPLPTEGVDPFRASRYYFEHESEQMRKDSLEMFCVSQAVNFPKVTFVDGSFEVEEGDLKFAVKWLDETIKVVHAEKLEIEDANRQQGPKGKRKRGGEGSAAEEDAPPAPAMDSTLHPPPLPCLSTSQIHVGLAVEVRTKNSSTKWLFGKVTAIQSDAGVYTVEVDDWVANKAEDTTIHASLENLKLRAEGRHKKQKVRE
jgi:hypothetical protein